jgi:TPR repeat protein
MDLFRRALELDDAGEADAALRHYVLAAEQGDAEAQFHVGLELMKTDAAAARAWYGRAARAGHAKARAALEPLAPLDVEEVRRAAAEGYPPAQYLLRLLIRRQKGSDGAKADRASRAEARKAARAPRDGARARAPDPAAPVGEVDATGLEDAPETEKSATGGCRSWT